MYPTTSNGLTTPHSQPAKTYTPNVINLDYPTGSRPCKQKATLTALFAPAGHVARRGPCNDYTACKFGQSRYRQDLVELNAFAVRLGVCHV